MGVQVPPAAPQNMKKKNRYNKFLILLFFGFFVSVKADNYLDYSFSFLIDACEITKQRFNPEKETRNDIIKGRNQYRTCMNFIMALSTTLNERCMKIKKEKISPKNSMTYADLSNIDSTNELIDEIMAYSKKFPHFDNQIAWLHASKALSQKWPCNKIN